mmetsp:Transcript_36243/g.104352  ORF Transcript_36243/g.104352 Transcript_36243/m.104352 type:complete len:305 (+) Transcript_36243:513-1427(+)
MAVVLLDEAVCHGQQPHHRARLAARYRHPHALLGKDRGEARRQEAAGEGGHREALKPRTLPQSECLWGEEAVKLRIELVTRGRQRLRITKAVLCEKQKESTEGQYTHLHRAAVERSQVEVSQHQRPAEVGYHALGQELQDLAALLHRQGQAQELQPDVLEKHTVLPLEGAQGAAPGCQSADRIPTILVHFIPSIQLVAVLLLPRCLLLGRRGIPEQREDPREHLLRRQADLPEPRHEDLGLGGHAFPALRLGRLEAAALARPLGQAQLPAAVAHVLQQDVPHIHIVLDELPRQAFTSMLTPVWG